MFLGDGVFGDSETAATDKQESYDVVLYTASAEYQTALANSRTELGPNLNIDLDAIEDPFLKAVAELNASAEVFRFDGSDLMPGAVGAGTFWTEITDWVIGGDIMGVMTVRAKWAFETKDRADNFIKNHGGRPANLREVIKEAFEDMYQDTLMIRKHRKLIHMRKNQSQ